ncbi:TPA: hypothetical protein ACQ0F8_001977 [Streptococcus agalactiae]
METRIKKGQMLPFISRLGADYGIVKIEPFDGIFYFEKLREEE